MPVGRGRQASRKLERPPCPKAREPAVTIRPPSDIVLEVAQSADPARMSVALRKLEAPGAEAAFADALRAARPSASADSNVAGRLAALDWPAGSGGLDARDPYQKLEAFLLQSLIQTMLPDTQSVFGRGAAASIHKSMLAEQLAEQMARAGGIGMSAKLAAAQQGRGDA